MNNKNLTVVLGLIWLMALVSVSAHSQESDAKAFSMTIMDALAITGRGTVLTGRVATGSITTGDTLCIPLKSGETVARKVDGIEMFRKELERAEAGQMAGILVQDVDSKAVQLQGKLHTHCELETEDTTRE